MKKTNLKIRGIYTTALTRLFLDLGYEIAKPSPETRERFQIAENTVKEDVFISDRDDRQGVRILSERSIAVGLIQRLQEVFLDMVVRRELASEEQDGPREEKLALDVEFPGASKNTLDELRGQVLPTMKSHHRLRMIASDFLDLTERQIERTPHKQEELEKEFTERFVYLPLKKHGVIQFEHVKPEGEILTLREGEIIYLEEGTLIIRRQFHQGRYDGLDLPIEPGDYGFTDVVPGGWFLHHRYFARGGTLKGEYFNVNTPIELYPDRIRYVDLHVDVVKKGEHAPRVIDQKELEAITCKGLISPRLQEKAMHVSRRLVEKLRADVE